MKKERCPGCGAAYNGKKCRNCGFQPFEKSRAQRPPVCQKTAVPQKQNTAFRSMIGFLILLALIALLLPALRNWGLQLEAKENAAVTVSQAAAD